jgi:hypothetical protein
MSVDKIGNTISSTVNVHTKVAEKKPSPQLEIAYKAPISIKPEKGIIKIIDPPFFPICVTQSMFIFVK